MASAAGAFVWRDVVGQRWIRCAVWQGVISSFVWLLLLIVLNPSSRLSGSGRKEAVIFIPFLWAGFRLLVFQASQLVFVLGQTFVSDPEERDAASFGDLAGGLLNLAVRAAVGHRQEGSSGSEISELRSKIGTTLDCLWFAIMCVSSGFLAFMSLVPSVQFLSGRPSRLEIGLRGATLGLVYAGVHLYLRNLHLFFPTIQRGLFFSFKMGILPAAKTSFKLALALLPLGELAALIIPSASANLLEGHGSTFLWQQLLFGIATFCVAFCWEYGHYNIQVLQTKQHMFAPPLGSAAAETHPSDLLLMVLEDPDIGSLLQYNAFLDLCIVSETNVDTWRRAAIFEETGDTYLRVISACLQRLDNLTLRLVQCVEIYQGSKGFDLLKYQMQSPEIGNRQLPSQTNMRGHFRDFQLCAWCARTVASLTSSSRLEDKYGVAQLQGCNIAVLSSLLSCLLVVEVYLGRRHSAQVANFVPNSIKWTVPSRGAFMEVGKRQSYPFGKRAVMQKKAYAMADVLSTALYQIVSVFRDEMVQVDGTGYSIAAKDWLSQKKPLFGASEMHLQKLRMFLDYQAG